MRISELYKKAVNFFSKYKTRYGCTAVVERMLLSKINEEELERLNNMAVPNEHTRQLPLYDTDIPFVAERYWEDKRIEEEKERRRMRNRPPRRKK